MLVSLSVISVTANTAQAWSGTTIVFIGDSLTKGYPNPNNWPYLVGVLTGARVVNLGVNYSGSAGIRYQVTQALSYHPKYVVVLSGANDIYRNSSWTESNLAATYKAIARAGVTPVLCTLPPSNAPNANDYRPLNAWITNYSNTYHYPLIDFYTPLLDPTRTNGENPIYVSKDGNHPNYAGYALMATVAADVLSAFSVAHHISYVFSSDGTRGHSLALSEKLRSLKE